MYTAKRYSVVNPLPYIEVSGVQSADVLVVDRNGIGVKHTTFFSGTQSTNVSTYEWYGVSQGTLTPGDYLLTLSNSIVGSDRQILYLFGPTPVAGTVYSVFYGSIIAEYVVQAGDTATSVRNGLKAAIDGTSWGTSVTTTSISTNRLQVDITGTVVDFTTQLGVQKYKKGYFITLAGINYILVEQEALNAYPVLPALGASYSYGTLVAISGTVEAYLSQPLTVYTYSDSVTGTTNIIGIPQVSGVPANQCVVDQNQQRVWFDSNLAFGEIIKIFEK